MRGPLGAVIGSYTSSDGVTQMGGGIIKHNRKCKDITALVIFIAFWIAMIVNSSFGFNQGNPLRYRFLKFPSLSITLLLCSSVNGVSQIVKFLFLLLSLDGFFFLSAYS
jgi:hypothetical protein